MRDAYRCLDGEAIVGGREASVPRVQKVSFGDPKKKRENSKKSSRFTRLARTKIPYGLSFLLTMAIFSGLCKSVSSAALQKDGIICWFAGLKKNQRLVRFTSKTLCVLHLTVLVDLILHFSTHHLQYHCHMSFHPTLSQIQCSKSRLAA
jgi:hypothetical protein